MDAYHKPEIFVRRMLYKPIWWKDYFKPEQVHWQTSTLPVRRDSTEVWKISTTNHQVNQKDGESNMTSIRSVENNLKSQSKQLIKVKMFDMATRETSEFIKIQPKKSENNFECIFEENQSKPLSPIYATSDNRMRPRNGFKKQKSPPRKSDGPNSAWQRILGLENVPFTSAEGKIIKDLVLERFEANRMNKENESTSRNLQDIINRFNNNSITKKSVNLSPARPQLIQQESYQRSVALSDKEKFSPQKCQIEIEKDVNENIAPLSSFKTMADIHLQTAATPYPKPSPLKPFDHGDSDSEKNLSSFDSNLSSSPKPLSSLESDGSEGSSIQAKMDDISFDPVQFLGDALGDEFYSSVDTTGNCLQQSIPQIATSNDQNNDGNAATNGKVGRATPSSFNEIQSVCTNEASELLSHRGDVPSTINMKSSSDGGSGSGTGSGTGSGGSGGSQTEDVDGRSSRSGSSNNSNNSRLNSNDKKIMHLMQQAAEQHYHMQQASKALSICRITKEFIYSEERLEAERLLLLAVLKNRAILEEINRMDHEGPYNENYQHGNLSITNIRVPITQSDNESIQKNFFNFSQWYLCIGVCGSQLYCSKIKTSNMDQELHFDEPMIFSNLPPDFVLDLYIYYLEQPKNIRNFSHTSKYHLDTAYKCPTPKKFFKKHVYRSSQVSRTSLNDYIRTPSFKLAGHIQIDLNNLNGNEHRTLKSVHRYLHGTIYMDIATNLQIYVQCSGFLTFGSEAGGYPSWSRHWFLLEGHYLKYWNYPSDADIKDPIGIIDLKKCVTPWIGTANEQICSKPRTLIIETGRPKIPDDRNSLIMECIEDQTIIRYLLSCDTDTDLKKWSKQLNLVVTFLKIWNLLDHTILIN